MAPPDLHHPRESGVFISFPAIHPFFETFEPAIETSEFNPGFLERIVHCPKSLLLRF
jgi:hypothetical protein